MLIQGLPGALACRVPKGVEGAVGLRVGPAGGGDRPAGLRHRLGADHPLGDRDADAGGRPPVAAVHDLHDAAIGGIRARLPVFEEGALLLDRLSALGPGNARRAMPKPMNPGAHQYLPCHPFGGGWPRRLVMFCYVPWRMQ